MFTVGREYIRRAIHSKWGGQMQGGISTPANYPIILIFTGESGGEYGYEDGWKDDSTFFYTGEGQVGDMQFTKGNKAIRDHVENGKDIYLFQYVRSGVVEFLGQMSYIGYHHSKSPDREGNVRRTIVFELQVTDSIMTEEEQENHDLRNKSLLDLRSIALDKANTEESTVVSEKKAIIRRRAAAIKAYALTRANGVCEACDEPAPFEKKNGDPFLEVHHLTRLSDGGIDHPENVAGICPNCHKRVHHGIDSREYNIRLIEKVRVKERYMSYQ